jgi:hypothetical protein
MWLREWWSGGVMYDPRTAYRCRAGFVNATPEERLRMPVCRVQRHFNAKLTLAI